jgi:hypothetical protein
MFEGVRAALAGVKPGKLVYMAIFDHRFVGKPTRPPLATLTWKDWKDQGQGPEIRRQGEPRTSFQPPPMAVSDSFIPAAVPQPAARVSAPPPAPLPSAPAPASAAPAPSANASVAQPVSAPAAPVAPISVHPHPVAITPLPVPIPSAPPPAAVVSDAGVMGIAPPVAGPPAADSAAGAAVIAPLPIAEVPASAASVPVAPTAAVPVALASAPPAPVAPLASVPVPPLAPPSTPPAAVSAPPLSTAIPSAPTTVAPAPALEAPNEASPSASVVIAADPAVVPASASQLIVVPEAAPVIPVTTPVAPSRPPAPSVPSVRQSGVDLIADLFECMHDLHFLPDALAGADFVLALMLDKLPSAAALVHFYDIDSREFVVVRAYGAGATKAMQVRTSEKEPLIAEAMRKRRAVVLDNAAGDPRAQNGRWALVGDPPRSLICAPVEQGGRFLGLLELSNPIDGQPFREGDGHAVTYIGEQFAEFLAERGIILDPERIGD